MSDHPMHSDTPGDIEYERTWRFEPYSDEDVIDEDGDIMLGSEVVAQCVSPDRASEIVVRMNWRWPSIFELQRGADVGYAVATRVLDFLKGLSDANQ